MHRALRRPLWVAAVRDEWGRRSVTMVNDKMSAITGPKLLLPEIRSASCPLSIFRCCNYFLRRVMYYIPVLLTFFPLNSPTKPLVHEAPECMQCSCTLSWPWTPRITSFVHSFDTRCFIRLIKFRFWITTRIHSQITTYLTSQV